MTYKEALKQMKKVRDGFIKKLLCKCDYHIVDFRGAEGKTKKCQCGRKKRTHTPGDPPISGIV